MFGKIFACFLVTSTILQSAVTHRQEKDEGGQLDFVIPDDYPNEEEINKHLKKFGMPPKPDYSEEELQKLMEDEDVQRIQYEEDDEMNCRTEVQMRKPYKLTYENRAYPVIQSKFFTQRIRNVSCKDLGHRCFKDISLKKSYQARCETEQGSIQLYVLDGEKVVAMPASFNCCCKCTIRDTM